MLLHLATISDLQFAMRLLAEYNMKGKQFQGQVHARPQFDLLLHLYSE